MNEAIRPSFVLDMTLPMFDLLEIRGTSNIKTLNNIIGNLEALHKALLRIEEEVNVHDGDDKQRNDV